MTSGGSFDNENECPECGMDFRWHMDTCSKSHFKPAPQGEIVASKAELKAQARLKEIGDRLIVGSDLHLCEMLLQDLEKAHTTLEASEAARDAIRINVKQISDICDVETQCRMTLESQLSHRDKLICEIEQENAELTALFNLQHTRMVEATKLWQQETGRDDMWPDLGDLLTWLMVRGQQQLEAAQVDRDRAAQ